jgi:DMSO/TMAO reductase YedYZ molybdopterin-dependent catalytic subunit
VRFHIRSGTALLTIFFVALLSSLTPNTWAQTAVAGPELQIGGAVSTPLVLTLADLKKMPRKTLSVMNQHNNKTETYEGVPRMRYSPVI